MYKLGFIGTGNMGAALAAAAAKNTAAADMFLSDSCTEKAKALAGRIGCDFGSAAEAAEECRYIFLGVKPQVMDLLLDEILPMLKRRNDRYVLVSMAAGVKIEKIEAKTGDSCPVIRIMPNMAASVGEGMMLLSANGNVQEDEIKDFHKFMAGSGRIDDIDEGLMDAGCALSGSAPAFVFMFIEALADGGVACGLPRAKALEYAAQTVLGAASTVLESGRHPGELKDAVCSPAGTTVAGVAALEEGGLRHAAVSAVKAAFGRAKELGK